MPLRAIGEQRNINAFECSDAEWSEIKRAYKGMHLVMPCCASMAIPKTSKLGNFFFSHAQRGECESALESAEHIYLKTLVAKAAMSSGWAVQTEFPGSSPIGEKWIADVLCEKGRSRVALEIQLSYQTITDLRVRQQIYRTSGIRAAWLASSTKFSDGYFVSSKDIPFFRVQPFAIGSEPTVIGFEVSLSEFVTSLLSKKIIWKIDPWVYFIDYLNDTCWNCRENVKQVFGYSIDVYGESAKTIPNMSTILEGFSKFISNGELKSLGLNAIGRFDRLKGNAPGFPYCNQCIYCGAPQNNYYIMKKLKEVRFAHDDCQPESLAIGCQEFISSTEGAGSWHYER